MSWEEKAAEIVNKINKFAADEDGWKVAKKTKFATVWQKQSPDWNGMLYKSESYMNADAETVFSFIEPLPESARSKWDKPIQELQTVERINDSVAIVRTITRSGLGGLISSRDFVDLTVTTKTAQYIATCSDGVEHKSAPASNDKVRGRNYPCAIICYPIPGETDKSRVVSYIQTDLGGMLPQTIVESALPANMVDFVDSLKAALQDGGHWKGADDITEQ